MSQIIMSPRRKKAKQSPRKNNNLKRESNAEEVTCKRPKVIKSEEDELKARKKKNFVEACRQVSCRAYSDHPARLLLLYYYPSCMKKRVCKHNDNTGIDIKVMPHYAGESFTIEMKNNMWYEALEVCQMSITPVQYLSANVLREIVEIMLNVHEDKSSEHTVPHIIDKCQQILAQNFSTHPPCIKSLKKCYNSFLRSPMDLKEKTYTNRVQYEYRNGVVKYCMNRLENEISSDSLDGPLINKCEHIPEEMKLSLKGLHWQKEKFEIFELLNRPDRIERLMAVLESIVELLQFDLAIWHTRYKTNLIRHIMGLHKPLIAFVLWSEQPMYTGSVTANCRQIIRLFVHLIHLQYPDSMIRIITVFRCTVMCNETPGNIKVDWEIIQHVQEYLYLGHIVSYQARQDKEITRRTENAWKSYWSMKELFKCELPMALKRRLMDMCILPVLTYSAQTWSFTNIQKSKLKTWLNIMIQTFYICEQESNSDYPNTSKYCTIFANEFYKIISEMPHESINRILERIEPAYMRHIIGMLHIKKLTKTNNDCIISIIINNIKDFQSGIYPPDDTNIEISKKLFFKPKKIKRILNYVIKNCMSPENCMTPESQEKVQYPKLDKNELKYLLLSTTGHFNLSHLVHTQYTTLEAYLDTYDVQSVEETWNKLNEKVSDESQTHSKTLPENSSYYVTENFIKKYKHAMKTIKELHMIFHDLKSSGDLPDMLEVFTNIELLE